MSRIESGKVSLTEDSFNLSDTIDSILTVFHSQVETKQLKLDIQIEKIEHENVIGDEQHLQQVFMNIMGNAVKFTPPGGSISIHIREKPSHISGCGCYEFSFADTGIGMEPDYIKTIFDPFISKPMFKSKMIHVLRSVLGGSDEEEADNALDTFQQQDYSGIRVLLVEDNDINVEVAQELLGIVGIQAETALNGQLAVDCVLEKEPGYYDLIFMDIQMPVMNGYEAARAIRSSGREDLRSIPIIAMTANAFSDDIRKARDAGMDDHISKPVDLGRLEEVLRKWIAQAGPKAKPGIDEWGCILNGRRGHIGCSRRSQQPAHSALSAGGGLP